MGRRERRRAGRTRKAVDVELTVDGDAIKARFDNLSESGAFVDTECSVPLGAHFHFIASLPDSHPEGPLCAGARVIWAAPMGLGVEFEDLSETARKRLKLFVT